MSSTPIRSKVFMAAAIALADPRSVEKRRRGQPVRGDVGMRIDAALAEVGLAIDPIAVIHAPIPDRARDVAVALHAPAKAS